MATWSWNPDNAALTQTREHWQKLFTLLLWKLAPAGVTITLADILEFERQQKIRERMLLTYGHRESFEFKLVTVAEGNRLAEYDAQVNRGKA